MNIRELQKYLKISRNTAYNLCKKKNFPATILGNRIIVSVNELNRWIMGQCYFVLPTIEVPMMKMLTLSEAQEILGISINTAYGLCMRCDFPAFRIGNTIRIPKEELLKWQKRNSYRV